MQASGYIISAQDRLQAVLDEFRLTLLKHQHAVLVLAERQDLFLDHGVDHIHDVNGHLRLTPYVG